MSRSIKFVLLVLAVFTVGNIENQPSQVSVDNGTVVGGKRTSANGQKYHSFNGIRYGKPPWEISGSSGRSPPTR